MSAPAAQPWLDSVERALLAGGHRSTTPRRSVIAWIACRAAPFSAEDAVAALGGQPERCSRPTIYRTIEWLRECGWIGRLHHAPNDYVRMLPGHSHCVICTVCGVATLLEGCSVEQALADTLAALDFAVQGHVLEIYGRCRTCRAEVHRNDSDPNREARHPQRRAR